jgi:hypothetical protein
MTLPSTFRLSQVPWVAVAGELLTALCYGLWGLFLPFSSWLTWPQLLFGSHIAIVTFASFALAVSLFRRRPAALKLSIFLAAYAGIPNLSFVGHVLYQLNLPWESPAQGTGYAVAFVGLLGQLAAVLSCVGRLAPVDTMTGSAPYAA